jgi:hypothetical protein
MLYLYLYSQNEEIGPNILLKGLHLWWWQYGSPHVYRFHLYIAFLHDKPSQILMAYKYTYTQLRSLVSRPSLSPMDWFFVLHVCQSTSYGLVKDCLFLYNWTFPHIRLAWVCSYVGGRVLWMRGRHTRPLSCIFLQKWCKSLS